MTVGGRMVKYLSIVDSEPEFIAADQIARVGRDEAGTTIIYLIGGDGVPARESPQVIADRIDDCYAVDAEVLFDADLDADGGDGEGGE